MTPTPDVVVVGSINLDISVVVASLPLPGETVLGSDALWNGGGKGANQAVAAAKLGRRVAMVGAVGADSAGADQLANLTAQGVDVANVVTLDGVSTGLAMIVVDERAENNIVVSPGANARLTPADVAKAGSLADAAIVLVQFEVPSDVVSAVAERCPGRLIVNPAPARPTDQGVYEAARAVVPNRGELAQLTGSSMASSNDELADQARQLACPGAVIITLGADGALIVEHDQVVVVPAQRVDAIDTTAAGDSFCGALADALVGGASTTDAVAWATRAAAVTVTRRGAQVSLPSRADLAD